MDARYVSDKALLHVADLKISFRSRESRHRAVDGVGFHLRRGEILGFVGESGSGKSVTCLSLLGLVPTPPAIVESGTALFDGVDLLRAPRSTLRGIRGRRIGMVFQDPMSALNPFLTIGEQVMEPMLIHEKTERAEAKRRAMEFLSLAGIADPKRRFDQYPHEFSGGMRQRVLIAMALVARPEILIADEPTTALDVTVQAQIIELLKQLRRELDLSIIVVTHDLGVIAGLCDRVQVMYAGRIVETASASELYSRPSHPYTRALLRSIPALHKKGGPLPTIPGMPPSPADRRPGCAFAPRCPQAAESCSEDPAPELLPSTPEHLHACPIVRLSEKSNGNQSSGITNFQ